MTRKPIHFSYQLTKFAQDTEWLEFIQDYVKEAGESRLDRLKSAAPESDLERLHRLFGDF